MKNFRFILLLLSLILLTFIENATTASLKTKSKSSRIIGGTEAFAGQFPYAAAIHVNTGTSTFFCGGTLTANQWILTAGHCVYNGVLFTVQLGSIHLDTTDPGGVTVATSDYILHPDFDPLTIQNDIGLLKLRMQVTYDIYMQPIHPQNSQIPDNPNVYISGWGQTSDADGELNNVLHYVQVSAISNAECQIYYGNQITDNMLCLIGNFNEGTCIGDNGGAAAVQNGRTYSIIGVASFVSGNGCESTYPSGFTRTYPYYNWIVNYTQEVDYPRERSFY